MAKMPAGPLAVNMTASSFPAAARVAMVSCSRQVGSAVLTHVVEDWNGEAVKV